MAVGGVRAGVAQQLDLDALEHAGVGGGDAQVDLHGVAGAGVDEDLLPGEAAAHRAAVHGQGHGRHQRLDHHVLLGAEAAADVRLDHLHLAPAQAQGLGDDAPHDVRDLGGGVDDDAAVAVHEGEGGLVLQVAVLDDAGLELPFEHPVGGAELRVDVPVLGAERADDVAGPLLVQHRGAFLHGVLGGEHERQHLVLHVDEVQRLLGREQVHRHHRGDGVAHEPGLLGEDQPVGHIPVGHVQGPGVPGGAELAGGQVLGQDDRLDPGQGPGPVRVDAGDPGMGVGAAQDLAHQHAPLEEVLGVAGPARHLGDGVQPLDALAHNLQAHGLPQSNSLSDVKTGLRPVFTWGSTRGCHACVA